MKQRSEAASPVSFLAHVAHLPQAGMPVTIEASPEAREALAFAHGLLSVESFAAELLVVRWKRRGVRVEGTVKATIVQQCVVTLEPVEEEIDEEVSALFLPEGSKLATHGLSGGEILLDAEGPDAPETFSGDSIDVGALAEEYFALAINPYPRKEGASLNLPSEEEGEESPASEALRAGLASWQRKS